VEILTVSTDYAKLVDSLTPDIVERFTEAVETGKWPDGSALTESQRDNCMQAIMLYNARHNSSDEPFTISAQGEIQTGKKMRSDFEGQSSNDRLRQQSHTIDLKTIDNTDE
jgi:uncharacterized protein YeaC (DUF1315 family)